MPLIIWFIKPLFKASGSRQLKRRRTTHLAEMKPQAPLSKSSDMSMTYHFLTSLVIGVNMVLETGRLREFHSQHKESWLGSSRTSVGTEILRYWYLRLDARNSTKIVQTLTIRWMADCDDQLLKQKAFNGRTPRIAKGHSPKTQTWVSLPVPQRGTIPLLLNPTIDWRRPS